MKTVGIRELKNRLSMYLRDARAGQTVAITDRGRVVAELTPPRTNGRRDAFAELVRRGTITLRKNDARAYRPRRKRLLAPGVLRRLLEEVRADR
jgi:prevent-host-death family protein